VAGNRRLLPSPGDGDAGAVQVEGGQEDLGSCPHPFLVGPGAASSWSSCVSWCQVSGWVGASPNLLNVAVSRARRLYVIGSYPEWRAAPNFGIFDTTDTFPKYDFFA
jgi:hypothetical protein